MHKRICLTFDVEDFINARSMNALYNILELLNRYNFKALFFITGHMAEKLSDFPEILDFLSAHEIGYHSSSHSVRPIIPEYTDVDSYEEAYDQSLEREVAHINPLTGEVEGKGGIILLRELFPKKKIVSFRAPGGCWSPPHLEALVKLGIKLDFSTCISSIPIYHKGVTFYPNFVLIDEIDIAVGFSFTYHALTEKIVVLNSHPDYYVNRKAWDSMYYRSNPKKLFEVQQKSQTETRNLFSRFESLLEKFKLLQTMNAVEVVPDLVESKISLCLREGSIVKIYEESERWSRRFFNYKTKFLRSHFFRYFMTSQIIRAT